METSVHCCTLEAMAAPAFAAVAAEIVREAQPFLRELDDIPNDVAWSTIVTLLEHWSTPSDRSHGSCDPSAYRMILFNMLLSAKKNTPLCKRLIDDHLADFLLLLKPSDRTSFVLMSYTSSAAWWRHDVPRATVVKVAKALKVDSLHQSMWRVMCKAIASMHPLVHWFSLNEWDYVLELRRAMGDPTNSLLSRALSISFIGLLPLEADFLIAQPDKSISLDDMNWFMQYLHAMHLENALERREEFFRWFPYLPRFVDDTNQALMGRYDTPDNIATYNRWLRGMSDRHNDACERSHTYQQLARSKKPALPQDEETADAPAQCIICLTNKRCVAMQPCGHLYACSACSAKARPDKCAVCSQAVTGTLGVFW
jgi:hypothetical protein